MTDQMPDEVWLDTYDAGPDNGPAKMQTDTYTPESVILPGSAVRYIRADLYDSKPCPHVVGEVTQHCALAEDAVRRLTERAEQAEAELAENEGVINVWRGRADRAEAELAARRADDESAANMLLLDLPEPGTPMAQMFSVRAQLIRRAEQAEAERDALRQQAEGWAQEARTQRATVHECYQACTGATGEPGDWHGADPVRAVVAERDRLRAALEEIRDWPEDWRRDGWAVAQEFQGIAQEALDHD